MEGSSLEVGAMAEQAATVSIKPETQESCLVSTMGRGELSGIQTAWGAGVTALTRPQERGSTV